MAPKLLALVKQLSIRQQLGWSWSSRLDSFWLCLLIIRKNLRFVLLFLRLFFYGARRMINLSRGFWYRYILIGFWLPGCIFVSPDAESNGLNSDACTREYKQHAQKYSHIIMKDITFNYSLI